MFVPVKEVGINTENELEKYLNGKGMDTLFEDIVQGKFNSINNHSSRKKINPDKLAYVDLSPMLPKKIIKRDNKVVEEDFER